MQLIYRWEEAFIWEALWMKLWIHFHVFFELLCTTELSKRHTHVFKFKIPVNKLYIIGHKIQFLRTNIYLISRSSSSICDWMPTAVVLPWFQCLVTKSLEAQRFHDQHLCVFQNAVTFSSGSEKNLVWKRRVFNSPTPSRKRAEAAEEKRKKLQCFSALSSYLPFYTHTANIFLVI